MNFGNGWGITNLWGPVAFGDGWTTPGGEEGGGSTANNSFVFLESNVDFDTQYALSGANPLWQYTSLRGGL